MLAEPAKESCFLDIQSVTGVTANDVVKFDIFYSQDNGGHCADLIQITSIDLKYGYYSNCDAEARVHIFRDQLPYVAVHNVQYN